MDYMQEHRQGIKDGHARWMNALDEEAIGLAEMAMANKKHREIGKRILDLKFRENIIIGLVKDPDTSDEMVISGLMELVSKTHEIYTMLCQKREQMLNLIMTI